MCFAPLDFRFCPKFLSGASCWFLQIPKTSLGLVCASAKLVSLLSICLLMCVVHEWMRGMMCQHLQIRVFIVYPHWSQMCRSLLTGLRLLDDCNILGPLTSRRLLFSTLFVHDTCATNSSLQVLYSIGFINIIFRVTEIQVFQAHSCNSSASVKCFGLVLSPHPKYAFKIIVKEIGN